ncbi:hypothetical protein NBO_501g0002, partial [Nosema bombycis CQ1]
MAADSTKMEKKNYLKLRIAPPRGKGSRKDDRPRAILHTDNIEIDTLLDINAVHNRMSEECARKLGCEIEIISEKMVSYDCGRTVLGKTDIEGLILFGILKCTNFLLLPLRCDNYESGYDYDSVGCILSDNEYWDEYTYDNSGYCESDSEDEIDSAKGEILDGVQE